MSPSAIARAENVSPQSIDESLAGAEKKAQQALDEAYSRTCVSALYKDRAAALLATRDLSQRFNVLASSYFCETCDAFHIESQVDFDGELHLKVATLTALGYRAREIADMLQISTRQVWHRREELIVRFGALSLPHLIIILAALGIIKPTEFLSPPAHRGHAWRVPPRWKSVVQGSRRAKPEAMPPDTIDLERKREAKGTNGKS